MEMEDWSQDELKPPQQERWVPLGAASSSPTICSEPRRLSSENEKVEALQYEKEELQRSLLSLTSRFAQIQFRLHQITIADPEEKPRLLEELDTLANQGCIDSSALQLDRTSEDTEIGGESDTEKHEEVIRQLKHQLDDLERYAFKHGSGSVPQSVILQKQQAILEQLTAKLNLNVDSSELAEASDEDLRRRVDDAVEEVVSPGIIKQKLVNHLQTQIQDLERFVEFLQIEGESKDSTAQKSSGSVPHSTLGPSAKKKESLALLRRALSIIQMFTITQLGCGTKDLQTETTLEQDTTSCQRLLTDLSNAVSNVKACAAAGGQTSEYDCAPGKQELYLEELEEIVESAHLANSSLTQVVRKELCPSITALLGHGLVVDATTSTSASIIVPVTCLLPRKLNPSLASKPLHPWELFMEYYEMKHGEEFAKAPSRMLTRSFNLEPLIASSGDHRISIKKSLLEAINSVIKEHSPLKRSYDIMLKALICIGLNSGQLVLWIRLLMKTGSLLSTHYLDHSYAAQTGFEGALTILSRLDTVDFSLPEDLAIRPFKNIRDAF